MAGGKQPGELPPVDELRALVARIGIAAAARELHASMGRIWRTIDAAGLERPAPIPGGWDSRRITGTWRRETL